jgi:hypothetical protein
MSDRPALDDAAVRHWLASVETPLGDLRRSLDCLLAITDRRGMDINPEALCWLAHQIHDNADAVHDHWVALWKLAFGRDPDPLGAPLDADHG